MKFIGFKKTYNFNEDDQFGLNDTIRKLFYIHPYFGSVVTFVMK